MARSRELSSAIAVFAAILLIQWRAVEDVSRWRMSLRSLLENSAEHLNVITSLQWTAAATLLWAAPVMLAALAIAGMVSFAQGGVTWAPAALQFSPNRLNPAERLKQLFSITAISSLLRSLVPAAVIIYIASGVLAREWYLITTASFARGTVLARWMFGLLFEICWKSGMVMLVWSAADYFFVRYRLEDQLKMSREELKQEHKETEGDPHVKARIRRLQRQVRRRRMLQDIATASVVVTNPTHYAIALAYTGDMPAPKVVAKGRDRLALQIKDEARWNNVPTVENPPLAHALYRAVPVGRSIPSKLYVAVAEVLAFVYRAQARARALPGAGS